MRSDLEARIDQHGLRNHITLTGWVDEARIRQELAHAHALVMPSFAEGLPMVVMEAMAAGRPVISTWIAGTPELVRDGQTGWMVPAGDVDARAKVIAALDSAEHSVLIEMGEAGRNRVLQRHNIHIEAARLADAVKQFV